LLQFGRVTTLTLNSTVSLLQLSKLAVCDWLSHCSKLPTSWQTKLHWRDLLQAAADLLQGAICCRFSASSKSATNRQQIAPMEFDFYWRRQSERPRGYGHWRKLLFDCISRPMQDPNKAMLSQNDLFQFVNQSNTVEHRIEALGVTICSLFVKLCCPIYSRFFI
jgi:hypothetical protein